MRRTARPRSPESTFRPRPRVATDTIVVARLQVQLEDDDEPVTAVENLEERLAVAAEGADYDADDPGLAVATAVVLYLARRGGQPDYDRDPNELIQLAVRNQWHGDPPDYVADWVAAR